MLMLVALAICPLLVAIVTEALLRVRPTVAPVPVPVGIVTTPAPPPRVSIPLLTMVPPV